MTGSGGREHALAWKLSQNKKISAIYCMPGNAGTHYTSKCHNIASMSIVELAEWAVKNHIDRLIVGSEDLLNEGIVDVFHTQGIAAIGPHQAAALLEGSKSFSKQFMNNHSIRTATHHTFFQIADAQKHIQTADYPLVIKADGIAAGKGVLICKTIDEAEEALALIMHEKAFGNAGNTVVIEQFLDGFETSILALYDGKKIVPMWSAKDHKKIQDGEQGKNTGGMGVCAPNPLFQEHLFNDFMQNILEPTQEGLHKEGLGFCGVIFFGLMIHNDECYLLEYNTRFGDPEIQTLLVLLDSDIHMLFDAMLDGTLTSDMLQWKPLHACCVVLASEGYPDTYEIDKHIHIPPSLQSYVFTAGVMLGNTIQSPVHSIDEERIRTFSTEEINHEWRSNGGRVLNVVAVGNTLADARQKAYHDIKHITFDNMYFRRDIGHEDT